MPFDSPADAFAWLDSHVNLESLGAPVGVPQRRDQPTLARMEELAALLGSPQLEYPVIHITGTNGKTTVARLASALLVAQGITTGMYTSPHLERVNERIVWDGEEISDEVFGELLALIADIEPHLSAQPSFFEIVTGAAYRYFDDVAVGAAVVEVGLGGIWDATNVADGRVAVVTNVSVDHVEYLGSDRTSIAQEKSGIVKPGATLVLGETDPGLLPIFERRAPAQIVVRDRDFGVSSNALAYGGRLVNVFTPLARYDEVFLSLHGAHQADNAIAALAAVECFLERPVAPEIVAEVFGAARSPGRLEVVGHDPLVLLDGAHNVAGAHALRSSLEEEFPDAPRTFVVGLLREKDPAEMLTALGATNASHLLCCRPPSPRAHAPEELAAAAIELGVDPDRVEVLDEVTEALERAREVTPAHEQIIVTGTLYLVGAARAALVRGSS